MADLTIQRTEKKTLAEICTRLKLTAQKRTLSFESQKGLYNEEQE
jgi:hypothetical protein